MMNMMDVCMHKSKGYSQNSQTWSKDKIRSTRIRDKMLFSADISSWPPSQRWFLRTSCGGNKYETNVSQSSFLWKWIFILKCKLAPSTFGYKNKFFQVLIAQGQKEIIPFGLGGLEREKSPLFNGKIPISLSSSIFSPQSSKVRVVLPT